ncbi:hypothetical protein ACO2J1_09415 [Leptospira interrogans]|uniref:Uncharacterized protein n=9 Tax=Leptospira interrogans TaxID=173 RepID=A0AAP9WI95_LEPIR|nr:MULTISPECIES: hypothetical protein [Leptospira]EMF40881.1 hypothetical protein LEP1GSC067_2301 [Leptospira interrogans serovar Lora str. TE 1992]EMM79066.1 hypothetical protein LEP1GSC037_3508 [Leptospira interrogans str. 2006001854]EMN49747.1 hypothetical protein LEP1GSC088_0194 [Leptospira interrogans str. L1207]AJR16519.1 hypothetical protein LIL_20317 [Leptospira interrogans serovar Linhai str. 56609]AKH79400.1 hypothetical protein BRAT_19815 [Leptospira interrogans serovar Bratislava]
MKEFPDLNPFEGSDQFLGKNPSDMSLEELKLYLHIQKLRVRLEFEKFQSSINYTGMVLDALEKLGMGEFLQSFLKVSDNVNSTEENKFQ